MSESADKDSGDESEMPASYYTDGPSARMAALAYKDIQHRVPPMNRRPERRSLDKKEKVVTMQMRRAESMRDMYSVDSPQGVFVTICGKSSINSLCRWSVCTS